MAANLKMRLTAFAALFALLMAFAVAACVGGSTGLASGYAQAGGMRIKFQLQHDAGTFHREG